MSTRFSPLSLSLNDNNIYIAERYTEITLRLNRLFISIRVDRKVIRFPLVDPYILLVKVNFRRFEIYFFFFFFPTF